MRTRLIASVALLAGLCLTTVLPSAAAQSRSQALLEKEVRKQMLKLPYLGVFDWLEAQVNANDGTVELRGEVVRASTKSEIEHRIKKLEGVEQVVNRITLLPPSPSDARIRRAVYLEVFGRDSPLLRYANQPNPPIHIIVNNGRVTLKGVVATQLEKQVAYARASIVPGIFGVKNELLVEK